MGIRDYIETAKSIPGRSQSLDIEDGDYRNLLIDKDWNPLDAIFGAKLAVLVHYPAEKKGERARWEGKTMYLSYLELEEMVDLIPAGQGRAIITAQCHKEPRQDQQTGAQALTKRGKPAFNTSWSFQLYAYGETLEKLEPPAKLVRLQPSEKKTARPMPRPLV